jgi:hypothetical protein
MGTSDQRIADLKMKRPHRVPLAPGDRDPARAAPHHGTGRVRIPGGQFGPPLHQQQQLECCPAPTGCAIRDFLDNSAIAYETAEPKGELKTAEIADKARAYTLLVTCTGKQPTEAKRQHPTQTLSTTTTPIGTK